MQLPFVPPRGLVTPIGKPRINYAHPASAYLGSTGAGVMLFNSTKPCDLLGYYGTAATYSGAPTLQAASVGQYLDFNTAAVQMERNFPASTPITLVLLCMRKTYDDGNTYSWVPTPLSNGVPGAFPGLQISLGNHYGASYSIIYITAYEGPGYIYPNRCWINGVTQSSTAPCDTPAVNYEWYCIVTTWDRIPGTEDLIFGAFPGGTFGLIGGGVGLCYIFPHILPDSLCAQLSSDPNALLIWPEDDIMATLVGTSASITTRPYLVRWRS